MLKIIFKRLAYILNALSHVTQPQSFKNDKFTLSFMILYIVIHILLNDAGIWFFEEFWSRLELKRTKQFIKTMKLINILKKKNHFPEKIVVL